MPVHRISVVPISMDSTFNEQGSIRTTNKSHDNEAHSLPQGASQPSAPEETCRDVNSGNHGPDHTTATVSVNHTPMTKQQVKHRYRKQRKSSRCIADCVDQSKGAHAYNESSSGDEKYHRATRSWSREKARRRRRPRMLTCSYENESQKQDLTASHWTSLKMEELNTESANHVREREHDDGNDGLEDTTVIKRFEEQGSEDMDMSIPISQKNQEASIQNGTPQEASSDDESEVCRICHSEGDEECPLITPCRCTGSLRFVHHTCLRQWIKSSDTRCCELCKYNFIMEMHLKPLRKWENLQLSLNEQRKIFCSVIFHLAAVACVILSLYTFILINYTAEGVQKGPLELLFWTKLGTVALSVVAGLIFMYIQCKVYLNLWRRLKAFNRIIFVHNCPDSVSSGMDKAPPLHLLPIHQTQTNIPCHATGGSAEVEPV